MIAAPMPHTGLSCSAWEPYLHFLVDGELDADDEKGVRTHLHACPACARAEAELVSLRQRLRLSNSVQLPTDLRVAIRDDLDSVDQSRREHGWFLRALLLAVTAVVVGAIVAL